MKIDLRSISNLVLSHGHFDHTRGVPELLEETGNIPVWAHPDFDTAKFRKLKDQYFYIGSYIQKEDVNFHPVGNLTQITDDVWAVAVPLSNRRPEFLPVVDHLMVRDGNGYKLDPFSDDISLVVKGDHGYSVILGCAHSGVVNILHEVSALFNTKEFHCVVGGMHIGDQSDAFCSTVVRELVNEFSVQKWRPCHCTGFKAAAILAAKTVDTNWGTCGTVLKV